MREIAAMRGIMSCAGGKFAGEVCTVRERVSGWLYLLGWTVVCRVPRRWAQWMFRQIADQLWRRQGPGVRQLEANLARVIGPDAPVMDLRRLSRDGMRSYLRYWLEVFRLPVIPPAEILGRMRAAGEEQTAFGHLAAGRGVIFALPHMGNWEHAGAWIVLRGAGKVTTVAERLRPESLYDRFAAFRERLGMEVLPHSAGASRFGVLAHRLPRACRTPRPRQCQVRRACREAGPPPGVAELNCSGLGGPAGVPDRVRNTKLTYPIPPRISPRHAAPADGRLASRPRGAPRAGGGRARKRPDRWPPEAPAGASVTAATRGSAPDPRWRHC